MGKHVQHPPIRHAFYSALRSNHDYQLADPYETIASQERELNKSHSFSVSIEDLKNAVRTAADSNVDAAATFLVGAAMCERLEALLEEAEALRSELSDQE